MSFVVRDKKDGKYGQGYSRFRTNWNRDINKARTYTTLTGAKASRSYLYTRYGSDGSQFYFSGKGLPVFSTRASREIVMVQLSVVGPVDEEES